MAAVRERSRTPYRAGMVQGWAKPTPRNCTRLRAGTAGSVCVQLAHPRQGVVAGSIFAAITCCDGHLVFVMKTNMDPNDSTGSRRISSLDSHWQVREDGVGRGRAGAVSVLHDVLLVRVQVCCLCIQCRSSNNEHQEIAATIVAIIHTMITAVIRRLKGFCLSWLFNFSAI